MFRYSLRGLLVLVFLICVLLAGYVWLLQDLHEQRAVAADLEGLGCELIWDSPLEQRVPTTPQWLIDLIGADPESQLNRIKYVHTDKWELPKVLNAAERLPHLTQLHLVGHHGPDEMSSFRALPNIRILTMSSAVVSEETMYQISRMQEITWLGLDSDIDAEGVRHLASLARLRFLALCADQVTSDWLPVIAQLPRLEVLELDSSRVSDKHLELLQKLPQLETLSLKDTDVTDAAVPKLSQLTTLKELYVAGSKITPAGRQLLKQALPQTYVFP